MTRLKFLALAFVIGSAALARPAAAEIGVVVTSRPAHAIVAFVMEGVGQPRLLVERGSLHTFSMRPSDARAVNAADVVFRVSGMLEPFTQRIFASLPERVRRVTLIEAPGLHLLNRRTGATFEDHDHAGHDHAHRPAAGHKNQREQKHTHEHAQPGDRDVDGHVWLDPGNARAIARHVATVLAQAAPQHAQRLHANVARFDAKITTMDAAVAASLASARGRTFVVFHDAFQYFEAHFGLEAVAAITLTPELKPSAARIAQVRRKIAASGALCVFAEPQFPARLVETVVEGSRARVAVIDPEGRTLAPGPGLYFDLMHTLGTEMARCLSPRG